MPEQHDPNREGATDIEAVSDELRGIVARNWP